MTGVFALVIVGMSALALVSALQASNHAYLSTGKRTKTFWVAVTAACTVYGIISVASFLAGGASSWLLQLIAATVAGVFLADVRPVVSVRRR